MAIAQVLLVLVLFTSCRKPEPEERADYLVENNSALGLNIVHTPSLNLDTPLLTDTVPPGERVHFLSVVMGSGGHVMPSNFFTAFSLIAGDSVIYSGVRNGDWRREGEVEDRQQMVLVIE